MNKQELQRAFSEIHASDDLIKEVLSAKTEKKKAPFGWKRVLRAVTAAAAVLAILIGALAFLPTGGDRNIITAPGVMKAYACETVKPQNGIATIKTNDALDIAAVETKNMILLPAMMTADGLGITLQVDEPQLQDCQIRFDISCTDGAFYTWELKNSSADSAQMIQWTCHDRAITKQNGDWFYWRSADPEPTISQPILSATKLRENKNGMYLQVIIYADEHIVGYAIFELINMDPQMTVFGVVLRESIFYPKVDGRFQQITEAYVQEQLQQNPLEPMAGTAVVFGGVYHSPATAVHSVDMPYMSMGQGIRYTCNVFDERYADREITFDFSMNAGAFYSDDGTYQGNFTVGNDTVLYWSGFFSVKEALEWDGAVFVDVIIRADGQVIGYAVIQIGPAYLYDAETSDRGDLVGCSAYACYSTCYPPVDGQLPNVTEEEVRAQIEAYKQAARERLADQP